ncbi:Solute carrier family 22 member 7 [Varanus komodoensis]|nr:Solute carrier family 22 member 7 [Varanus komodoensis]
MGFPRWSSRDGPHEAPEKSYAGHAAPVAQKLLASPGNSRLLFWCIVMQSGPREAAGQSQSGPFSVPLRRVQVLQEAVATDKSRTCSYWHLVKTPELRKTTLCSSMVWFGVAFTYYGISLNITGFSLDPYLTQLIFGAIEVPAKLSVYFVLDRIGRRRCQSWSLIATASLIVLKTAIPAEHGHLRLAVALLGKGFSEISFTTAFLYTAELYPTVLRQSGIGCCSFVARIASSVAPLIMLLEDTWRYLPPMIFSVMAGLAGLAAFLLTETTNVHLPDTIQDVENGRGSLFRYRIPSKQASSWANMNFEDLLQEAGGFGKFQVLTLLLLCLPRVLLPLHFLLHNFLAAIPPHHCAIPHQEQFANLTEEDVLLINIPRDLEETFSSCEMFSSPQFHLLLNSTWAPTNSTSAQKCQHGWVYDHSQFTATIATQWDLVCEHRRMNQAAATIFFIGVMLGAVIFGSLSDRQIGDSAGVPCTFCPSESLPELMEIVSDLVLKTPRMLVLGDFNLHAETGLTGVAQDFMASMTAMGLSQHVIGLTHEHGHTLDLVFSMGQEEGDLRVSNLCLAPLSWSDHFLVRFELDGSPCLCKSADPIVLVLPQGWMDPDGFLKALGEFPDDKAGAPVDALVELWNGEMARAIDTIAPKHPLPLGRARSSPWYTPELRAMKRVGRWQEPELFWVVQGLVHPGPKKDPVPPSITRCDDFAQHFKEKIAQIHHELDSTSDSDSIGEVPILPSGHILLDEFQLLRPNDVDKVLGQKVVLGDYGSAPWQLCHGVPQGSILYPMLFNIYMKPLGEFIWRCGLRNHQYADDTQLNLSFSTNSGEAVAVLNWCLAEVMGWMRANKLKLNPDKTEVLLVGGSGSGVGDLDLVLNGVALPLKDRVRSLGVILNPELSLEAQVTAVARSAFLQLRLIHQLRPYLEVDCLATVTHALVTSRLNYCNALPLKTVWILQMVQNRAARFGRKRMLQVSYVCTLVFGIVSSASVTYSMLVVTRALTGMAICGLSLIVVPLGMEWVDIQHRTLSGILTSVFWSLGNMLLALIAYLVRDWRWLLLAVTLPCAVGLVSTWWLSESARWLLANGRHKEAHRHLQRCANMNKRKEFATKINAEILSKTAEAVVQASGRTYSYVTLFRTPMLRKISFCMGTVWFGAAFSYYGISMDITGFGLGMYMTQFVFGIIELPAKAIVFVTANRFGRRQSQAWSLILTGLCVGANIVIPTGLGMLRSVVAIIGKGLSEASFTLVFLYTAELFPTVLRQNGQGYCSFMARLGGSVAPLVFLLDSLWKPLPQVMYCALAVLCGSTAFLLPETLDAELPETVEDVEKQSFKVKQELRGDVSEVLPLESLQK